MRFGEYNIMKSETVLVTFDRVLTSFRNGSLESCASNIADPERDRITGLLNKRIIIIGRNSRSPPITNIQTSILLIDFKT